MLISVTGATGLSPAAASSTVAVSMPKTTRIWWVGWLLICSNLWLGTAVCQEASLPAVTPVSVKVTMHTSLGDIVLALAKDRAPVTVNNFLRYVDQKRFDGCNFYRAVNLDHEGKFGLIQGGLRGNPKRVLRPIAHEPTTVTGLSHVDGAVSMARAEPGTANGDFFIVVGDAISYDAQPGGDPGYAAFGRVIEGMDVVRSILGQPRSEGGQGVMKGQMIANPVKIWFVRRTE
jgi:peptidyl-prolyl cis-trans isomerase A (cyclophilin A)